jgi:hypothetical protein
MANKKILSFVAGTAFIVCLATFFSGCSTFPTSQLKPNSTSYDILGLIDGDFSTYADALAAAKTAYPSADAVIRIKATPNDNLIPLHSSGKMFLGYFAVKLKNGEAPKF